MNLLVLLAYAVVMLTPGGAAHAGYADGYRLFNFLDGNIAESSGLVASSTDPGTWYTHNDSGDNRNLGRFFAVGPDGNTKTTFAVTPSLNIDWEDMAAGPGSQGGRSLFFADFGDNYQVRTLITIYEVAEPSIDETVAREVRPVATRLLAFEDGPHNAETLLVDPADGTLFVVTKDAGGKSGVYAAAPGPLPEGPGTLRRVADLDLRRFVRPGASLLTTGGDIAPDGSRLVIRTYDTAYEWRLGPMSVAAALDAEPLPIPLPQTVQGEAITYTLDSESLATSSEGRLAPVHLIPGTD